MSQAQMHVGEIKISNALLMSLTDPLHLHISLCIPSFTSFYFYLARSLVYYPLLLFIFASLSLKEIKITQELIAVPKENF